jgi:uncharacterized membrane protein YjjB (DUF3815 family)
MSTVACAGYAASFALSNWVHTSQQVMQLVPAFVVGVLGNGWTKWRKQMSFDAILLGAFFLVPGNTYTAVCHIMKHTTLTYIYPHRKPRHTQWISCIQ